MSTLQAVQLLKQKKRDANVRVVENITGHSQSKNPAGKDAVSAVGGTPAATLEACPVHSAASVRAVLSVYLALLLSRL